MGTHRASTESCGMWHLDTCPELRGHTGGSRTPLLSALKANTLRKEAEFTRFPEFHTGKRNSDKTTKRNSRINELRGPWSGVV